MAIEDHLGHGSGAPTPLSHGAPSIVVPNPDPHPLMDGPFEECPNTGTDYPDKEVVVYQEAEFDGVEYTCWYCRGCGKQWWRESGEGWE